MLKNMKKLIFIFIFELSFFNISNVSYSWFKDDVAESIKNATLYNYPQMTLGKAVEGFVGNPKWESIIADDGGSYVNLTGKILLHDKKVNLAIQYKLNPDGTFEFNAMELNEIPQNLIMYSTLLEKMYE